MPVIFKSVSERHPRKAQAFAIRALRQRDGICAAIVATHRSAARRPAMDSGAYPAWGNRDALGHARTVVRPTAANPDLGLWRHGPYISIARKSVRCERWRAKGCAKPISVSLATPFWLG